MTVVVEMSHGDGSDPWAVNAVKMVSSSVNVVRQENPGEGMEIEVSATPEEDPAVTDLMVLESPEKSTESGDVL
jgi:hypothetical protein